MPSIHGVGGEKGGVMERSGCIAQKLVYGLHIHHILVLNFGVNLRKDWRLIDSDQRLQTSIKQCGATGWFSQSFMVYLEAE